MDAFEQLVALLLNQEGYWTRLSYKVDLTKQQKRDIGKPSMPRPEIDILAYKLDTNTICWIECKSYLDSSGVSIAGFDGTSNDEAKRYKIFSEDQYREIASQQLVRQVIAEGLTLPNPKMEYWLVAGKIKRGSEDALRDHFQREKWTLQDRNWLVDRINQLADMGYENNISIMVAKLLR